MLVPDSSRAPHAMPENHAALSEQQAVLTAAKCAVALAPKEDKLRALQDEALRLAPLVKNGRIPKPDAVDTLVETATAHGLYQTERDRQNVEHVIGMGLNGQTAGVSYRPPPQTQSHPISRVAEAKASDGPAGPACVASCTIDETLAVFERWLALPDKTPIYAVLGTVPPTFYPAIRYGWDLLGRHPVLKRKF